MNIDKMLKQAMGISAKQKRHSIMPLTDIVTKNIFLKGQGIPDNKFNKGQLMMGMKVEREHSNNPKIRKGIAKGHLVEFPNYYTYLAKMEMQIPKSDKQGKSVTYPISSEGRHRVTAVRDKQTKDGGWEKEWEKDFGSDFGLTEKEKAKRQLSQSKAAFGGKVQQEKEMSDTSTPVFFGPRRKAGEGEYWAPFKIEDKQAFVLKKKQPSLKEAISIMKTPFLTGEEKANLIKEKGGSDEMVKRAEQFSSGAHKMGIKKWRRR